MGVPPMRFEVLTEIDGVDFSECFEARASRRKSTASRFG
jgi:hypothetical protein